MVENLRFFAVFTHPYSFEALTRGVVLGLRV